MSFGGSKFPPLTPPSPPTPLSGGPLLAELQAQGRRSGLRAAILSKIGQRKQSNGAGKARQMSGE